MVNFVDYFIVMLYSTCEFCYDKKYSIMLLLLLLLLLN